MQENKYFIYYHNKMLKLQNATAKDVNNESDDVALRENGGSRQWIVKLQDKVMTNFSQPMLLFQW